VLGCSPERFQFGFAFGISIRHRDKNNVIMETFYASKSETQSATTLPAGVNAEARRRILVADLR
jgi:hypothetical protein